MKLFYYPSQILIHCFTWNTFNSIFIFFSFFSMFHVKLFFYWFTLPYPSKKSNFLIFKIFTFLYQKNFFDYSSDTYLLAVSRETYSPFLYKNYFTETLQIHFSNSSIQLYFLVFFLSECFTWNLLIYPYNDYLKKTLFFFHATLSVHKQFF